MSDNVQHIIDALAPPGMSFHEAQEEAPARPGLYALYASTKAAGDLGLDEAESSRPVYIGKSESNLRSRDIGQHFRNGRTGSSTVRRSLAGLLVDQLELEALPRNPQNPEGFANFGLAPECDERLTEWMRRELTIAFWPSDGRVILARLESRIILSLRPVLNLAGSTSSSSVRLSAGRARLAAAAKLWAAQRSRV